MQEIQVSSLSQEDQPEKEMASHSSILAWGIPRTEKPGGLQSMGSQRVRHDLVTKHHHHPEQGFLWLHFTNRLRESFPLSGKGKALSRTQVRSSPGALCPSQNLAPGEPLLRPGLEGSLAHRQPGSGWPLQLRTQTEKS